MLKINNINIAFYKFCGKIDKRLKGWKKVTIQEICTSFNIDGKYAGCKELSTGNINCTYLVKFNNNGEEKHYIVQRINTNVFKEPEKVMDNIVRVTAYVRKNITKKGLATRKFVLRVFTAKDDELPYLVDNQGSYWRCYRFIPNATTYDVVDDINIIEKAGTAFGRFQSCLDGFRASSLHQSIPNFHNTIVRYNDFKDAIKKDPAKRVAQVKAEIDALLEMEEQACKLQTYLDKGDLPLRVTHNDTKCNNVSFDKDTGEPLAVLDLDTVMPGAVAHDFGDAIRFIANTKLEDDPDYQSVKLDVDKYKAFARGFLREIKGNLTPFEKETMNLGPITMTAELAVRFLTDYILGDSYFKIKYPGHNIDRARNQIALAKDILSKQSQTQAILDEIYKE